MPTVSITGVFQECQKGIQGHGKLVKSLKKIYDQTTLEEFWLDFLHHMKYSLIVFKREPAIERTIGFIAKFSTSLLGKEDDKAEQDEDSDEEDMHPFLSNLFGALLQYHNANDKAVRFRCCQLINKLLGNMGEDAQIDDDLYDKIYHAMLQRLKDKFPVVRVHAAYALSRLQDPMDNDCPVIKAYLMLMSSDPNPEVRKAILSCIAVSTKTLASILERTKDVKDIVRKVAYQIIAEKVHIKALTIAQRVRIIQEGLHDRSEIVREACAAKLLQAWLRLFQGNILELLKCLDVENSVEVSEEMLKTFFKTSPNNELMQNFDLLNEDFVILLETLNCENSFYWRVLCQYIKSQGVESEELLEKIQPVPSSYCKYLISFLEKIKGEEDFDEQMKNEFILHQLLDLAGTMDLADEVGRREFGKLLHKLLLDANISHSLVKPIYERYVDFHKTQEARVNQLVEIISDIREPITVIEKAISKEEQRQIDIKLAGCRVKLNELRDELANCIENQDYSRAAEIKNQIGELDYQKQTLLDASQPQTQEIRTEKNDPQTWLKCLTIACEMLQDLTLQGMIPSLQTLIESLVLPGIQNEDPAVRNIAVKCLGLCCLLAPDTAKHYLMLLVQVSRMDQEGVQITALQAIFDLLHTFGLELFNVSPETPEENESKDTSLEKLLNESEDNIASNQAETENEQVNTACSLLNILLDLLDSESSDVRTTVAEGLAKLLLAGRVASSKLISRLLLLWYNPITEDDGHLRHCLGTFFPVYAFAGRVNQEQVEEAFLPTLKTLFQAPVSSPLIDVDVNNVCDLLVQLTNGRHLVNNDATIKEEYTCHDNLAVKTCNEILEDPGSFNVKSLCRILSALEISDENITVLKDLCVLSERTVQEVKDKQCNKTLVKFSANIKTKVQEAEKSQMKNDSNNENEENVNPEEAEGGDKQTEESDDVNDTAKTDVTKTNEDVSETKDEETESETNVVFASPTPVRRISKKLKRSSVASEKDSSIITESDAAETPSHPAKRVTRSSRKTSRGPLSGIGNEPC